MADNIQLNSGSGGDILAAIDTGSEKIQEFIDSGVPSSGNTTTSTLSGGQTFTGTFEDNRHPDVMVSCKSDTAGTLYFDFSVDGTNVETFPTNGFSVAAGIHEFHVAVKGPRQFRVRFVNSSTAQSSFRLYTYYGQFRQPNAPLNQPLGLDSDAILVRPTFSWLDVSRGLVSGMSVVKKFGRNPSIGTSFSPVCQGGIYRTPQVSAATTLRIKAGGNTNDTAEGLGAREITLEGLDENFDLVSESIATNGSSASTATTATFTRLFRAYVSSVGTYASATAGSHYADIVIENSAGTEDWATISDDIGFPIAQSEIGSYSVPRNYTAYVFLDDFIIDTSKTSDLIFFHRGGINETAAPYTSMRAKAVFAGIGQEVVTLQGKTIPFGPFTGPCDIGFMAKVNTSTASVTCEFEIFLVQE